MSEVKDVSSGILNEMPLLSLMPLKECILQEPHTSIPTFMVISPASYHKQIRDRPNLKVFVGKLTKNPIERIWCHLSDENLDRTFKIPNLQITQELRNFHHMATGLEDVAKPDAPIHEEEKKEEPHVPRERKSKERKERDGDDEPRREKRPRSRSSSSGDSKYTNLKKRYNKLKREREGKGGGSNSRYK